MLRCVRRLGVWRKIAVLSALAAGAVLLCGLLFDFPVRFRPKWTAAPNSLETSFPSGRTPDNLVLLPYADMAESVTISWRTSAEVPDGVVQYGKAEDDGGLPGEAGAGLTALTSVELKSDQTVHCFSATLDALAPATRYTYRVGSKTRDAWSEYRTFTTAARPPGDFTFVYLGDTQVNPERVGALVEAVDRRHPETSFYLIGGDLVNAGDLRNQWDALMANVGNVFSRKPVALAMGNHDFGTRKHGAAIFNAYFNPPGEPGHRKFPVPNYGFRRGDAYFIVVNGLDVRGQTRWLESELRRADAEGSAFKIVMFHIPVHHPKKNRRNRAAINNWVPLFDKYGVDLVLSGHDHSYMRSKPLRSGKAVPAGQAGTVHVVATACGKSYAYRKLDIAEVQFTDTITYQLITVGTRPDGRRFLEYTACDPDGKKVDAFNVAKPGR